MSGKRLGLVVAFGLTALVMIYLSHALPRLLPGDFVTAMYASSHVTLTSEQEAELRAYYTSNENFAQYLVSLACLDWGYSYAFLTPVSELILEALPWTLLLLGGAQVISILLGFAAGVEAAWRHEAKLEKGMVGTMTLFEGVPEISTGIILLSVFAFNLEWFPAAGADTAYAQFSLWQSLVDVTWHLALPLVTLVLAYLPGNFLLTRNSMIMVIKEPFITTARGKGLAARRIKFSHAARNALLPVVTRVGMRLSFVVTGALVIETLFSYPGLGTLLFNAIQNRDLPLIQGIVLVSSLLVLVVNFALEMIYLIIDPRIENAY